MAFLEMKEIKGQRREPPVCAAPFRQKIVEKGKLAERRMVAMRNQKRLRNVSWRLRTALAHKCEDSLQSALEDVEVLRKDGILQPAMDNDKDLCTMCTDGEDMLGALKLAKKLKKAQQLEDRDKCRERTIEALNNAPVWDLGNTISDALRYQAFTKDEAREICKTFKTLLSEHHTAEEAAESTASIQTALREHASYPTRLRTALQAARAVGSEEVVAEALVRQREAEKQAKERVCMRQRPKLIDSEAMEHIMAGQDGVSVSTVPELLAYYYWRATSPRSPRNFPCSLTLPEFLQPAVPDGQRQPSSSTNPAHKLYTPVLVAKNNDVPPPSSRVSSCARPCASRTPRGNAKTANTSAHSTSASTNSPASPRSHNDFRHDGGKAVHSPVPREFLRPYSAPGKRKRPKWEPLRNTDLLEPHIARKPR